MIPKKVRKIISIMIAVMLVMAVFPAVSFADDGFFGNGDENVASTGDATESEDVDQVDEAIDQDENAPQTDEAIATDEAGDENVDNAQPEEVAQVDTDVDVKLMRNRGSVGGNLDSLNGLSSIPTPIDDSKFTVEFDTSNAHIPNYREDQWTNPHPAYYYDNGNQVLPTVSFKYDGTAILPSDLPEGYTLNVSIDTSYIPGGIDAYYDYNYTVNGNVYGVSVYIEHSGTQLASAYVQFYILNKPSYTVTFHKNYGGDDSESSRDYQTVTWNNTIDTSKIPTFSPAPACEVLSNTWYTDAACTQEFDFSTPITKACDLYAKWTTTHTGTAVHQDGVPATCSKEGSIECYKCSACNRYYLDKNRTNEIADISIPIDTNAHDWEQPTYQWANDNSAVTASRVCKNDASHTENDNATTTSEVTKKATCSSPEEITYTATFTNTAFETQTKTVASGSEDPNAHDWGEVTYKWANDNSSVTAIRTCKNDISHNETETVQTTKTVTKEATETAPGDILYSAEFSNPAFKKQTKYEEIPAKGTSETKKSDEPVDDDAFYVNASGDKITWTVGSTDTLNIKFERSEDNASTSKHFLGIEVDGKAVSKDLYDTEDGSIIIKLKPALLESLGEGEHTLTALFDDGSASAKFTIIKATKEVKNEKKTTSKNAKTGDASPIKLVIIIMIVSALACAGVLVIKKKRQ